MSRWLTIGFIALQLGACSSASDADKAQETKRVYAAVDGALLTKSWPVRMADDTLRARFEGHPGWRAVFEQDLAVALPAFGDAQDGRGLARVHQGLSDLYRQASLLTASATIEAFDSDASETDPLDLAYVIGVSHAIRGDYEKASQHLGATPSNSVFSERAASWTAALSQAERIPKLEVLSEISGSLGDVQPGVEPTIDLAPDAEVPERTEKGRLLAITDPTRFLTRSAWHSAAAAASAPPTDAGVLDQISARYSTAPPTQTTHPELPLDDAWLFASADLVASDVSFIAEAKSAGIAAVSTWSDRSVLAAALVPSIKDGAVEPQAVLDAGLALQKQLQAMMADVGGGEMAFHRPFAQRARAAVLMAGMVVADANDQYRDAGILRLNALERQEEIGMDVVFAISVAAWDAGNRNPMRPEELTHQFKSSYPALSATRAPLEALHLRRSRNAGPSNPVH